MVSHAPPRRQLISFAPLFSTCAPYDKVKLEWKMTNLAKLPNGAGFKITYDTPEGEKVGRCKLKPWNPC